MSMPHSVSPLTTLIRISPVACLLQLSTEIRGSFWLWKRYLKNLLRHTMLKLTSKTFSSRVTLLKHLFSIVSYDKKKALIVAFFEYCKVSLTTPSAYYLRPHIHVQPVTLHSAVLHKKNLQKSSLMWLVEPSLHDCTKCLCGINMLTAPGLHS